MRRSFILASLLIGVSTSLVSSRENAASCICTQYSQIAAAVKDCTNIILQDIAAPTNSTINLAKLKDGAVVTFAGKTTFAFTNDSKFDPIVLGGRGVTITSAPGAIIDGNGQAYWDGLGSNGGVPKPNTFITVKKMTNNSVISNLNIINWPVHLFAIQGSSDVVMRNMVLDNRAGEAPNNRSGKLAAAHNSDGYGVKESSNILIANNTVYNQDDCVAVTSGNNITVDGMFCQGSHGLSIGSIGGKSNNNVTNVLFSNSIVKDSQNGARIKSNFNTTGYIANITYIHIALSNISDYGIDIQQDYLNGGPTGTPSNGVKIENVLFKNVTGTSAKSASNYKVLCGAGSCTNIVFDSVKVTGGMKPSSCNFPASGCPK